MKKSVFFSIIVLSMNSINGQDLQAYIEEAVRNNPKVQAYELRHNLAQEKLNEVNALPNTQLAAGYFISEPETRTGAQKLSVSVNQMLPWFGTITARENYASSLADASYEELAVTRRKLSLEVSESYYRLYSIRAEQMVLNENIELLKNYEKLALTSVEVGNTSAVDVLKLQIRQNELVQRHSVLEQQYRAEKNLFNQLLNRKGSLAVDLIEYLSLPEEDPTTSADRLELHPELMRYDKLFESVDQAEFLNRKEASPDIGLGVNYVAVEKRPELNFEDNGKDIFMPMLSVSLPIFNQKYKSRSRQFEMQQQEIQFQKTERRNRLEALLQEAVENRNAARISYDIQSKNIEIAKKGEDILIKNYETGTINFNDVLDIQELQLKYQVAQIASVRSFYSEWAIINYLTL